MKRAGKEIVRLQRLLKKRGGGGVDGDFEGGAQVLNSSSNRAGAKREGKLGGRLNPSWLSNIDKSGDDLNGMGMGMGMGMGGNVAGGEATESEKPSVLGGVLRRSFELRQKAEVLKKTENNTETESDNNRNSNKNDGWSGLKKSMAEGSAAEKPRNDVPRPVNSKFSPRVTTTTTAGGGGGGGGVKQQQTKFNSQSDWAASLNLSEAVSVESPPRREKKSGSALDDYIANDDYK